MVLWVLGDTDSRLVVHVQSGWSGDGVAKFTQKVAHPGYFLACFNSCNELCFSGRKSNNTLQFATPTNCTTQP